MELKLADYQRKIYDAVTDPTSQNRTFAVVASTRSGKTFTASLIALNFLSRGQKVIIIAPTYKQSQIILQNIREIAIRFNLKLNITREKITHGLGEIQILSAHEPSSLLGHGGQDLLIIDECAEIPDDVFYQYIWRMTTTKNNNRLLCISTPHKVNWFMKFFNDADWKLKITVEDAIKAGIMDQKMVEEIKQKMLPEQFDAWFMAKWQNTISGLFPTVLNDDLFIDHPNIDPNLTVWGLDFGLIHDSTFLVGGVKVNDEIIITQIHKIPNVDANQQALMIKSIVGNQPVYVDAGAFNLVFIQMLRNHGLNVRNAYHNNDQRNQLIISTAIRFRNSKVKFVRELKIWINDLILGFESYNRQSTNEKISKSSGGKDDLIDALIYLVGNLELTGEVKIVNSSLNFLPLRGFIGRNE